MAVPPVGSGSCEKNRSAGFQPAEGPLKCNDLYAGETPALQFFTLRGMKSLAINSELPHTAKSVTGETPVPRWLRGMAVPPVGSGSCEKNRSAGFQPAEGPLKCNDLYAGETPVLRWLRGMAVPPVGSGSCEKNRSAGFQPAEGPLKCNDLYAGETPALQFFTLRGMKSLAINSEL